MKANQHKHALPGGQPVLSKAAADAEARMFKAKELFSCAALSCLRGDLNAPTQVQRALAEVDGARAALRKASDAE